MSDPGDALHLAERAISRGSLSFALAAKLLGKNTRSAVVLLYSWCRYCDDMIDGQELGTPDLRDSRVAVDQEKILSELKMLTDRAVAGALTGNEPAPFKALAVIVRQHHLPRYYLDELLAGMAMDVRGHEFKSFADLLTYCYRVAGTVGLLFAHIAGVSDPVALQHAAELGIGMQLTNIARDIAADWRAGRVYLPDTWLAEVGLTRATCFSEARRDDLFKAVTRLLKEADSYYRSGDEGLKYLPIDAAAAVAAARAIYADIGRKVLQQGARGLASRQIVSTPRKLFLAVLAAIQTAKSVLWRYRRPWQPAPLEGIWRLS